MEEWPRISIHWLVCRIHEPEPPPKKLEPGRRMLGRWKVFAVEPPSEIPLLGTSLAALLEAALETGGEIGHLETGRLAQLLLRDKAGGASDDE